MLNIRKKVKHTRFYILLQAKYTVAKYRLLKSYFNKRVSKSTSTFPKIKRGAKVLYVGTDEYQDKSGFLQELGRLYDVEVFRRSNGEYGQYSERRYIDGYGPKLNTDTLELTLERLFSNGWKPDLVLTQTWARLWNVKKLAELKAKYDFKFVNICMDDRHSFWMFSPLSRVNRGSSGLIPILDGALVTAKEIVHWYQSLGVPAKYFPEATSSDFYFKDISLTKKYDVGFVGANYGIRGEYIQHLVDNGVDVKAYGTGWPDGRISNEHVNKFMNECRIVVGFGYILGCEDFFALKLRDFDVPSTGSFYLTTDNMDLYDLFPEKEGCYFSSKEELLLKVRYYLSNPLYREQIASKSLSNIRNNHLYSKRLTEAFQ